MDSAGLNCPKCDYDLTGLPSNVCPECGTAFDVEFLRLPPKLQRTGTPVYGGRGLALIPQTMKTLLLMLFRPRRFAWRIREDEPLLPAMVVCMVAIVVNTCVMLRTPWPPSIQFGLRHNGAPAAVLSGGIGALVVAFAGALAIASSGCASAGTTLRRRFRFWLIVTTYSTVFITLWPLFGADAWELTWEEYTVIWPFFYLYYDNHAYVVTLLLLWPTLILSTVLWYRHRPRWMAIIFMPVAFLFVRACVQVADMCIVRLAR